jgi:hypothetical protein
VTPAEANDAVVADATVDGVQLACECGTADCAETMMVTIGEYQLARDARARLTCRGHAQVDGLPYAEFERFGLVFDE